MPQKPWQRAWQRAWEGEGGGSLLRCPLGSLLQIQGPSPARRVVGEEQGDRPGETEGGGASGAPRAVSEVQGLVSGKTSDVSQSTAGSGAQHKSTQMHNHTTTQPHNHTRRGQNGSSNLFSLLTPQAAGLENIHAGAPKV